MQLFVQINELQSHIGLCRFWARFLQVVELEVKQDAEELREKAAAVAELAQVCQYNRIHLRGADECLVSSSGGRDLAQIILGGGNSPMQSLGSVGQTRLESSGSPALPIYFQLHWPPPCQECKAADIGKMQSEQCNLNP